MELLHPRLIALAQPCPVFHWLSLKGHFVSPRLSKHSLWTAGDWVGEKVETPLSNGEWQNFFLIE